MKAFYQNFIGTTEEWNSENPLLYEAVFGIEITSGGKWLLKIGDGVSDWQHLRYVDKTFIKNLPEDLQEVLAQALNAVALEAAARQNADAAEAAARGGADATLQGNINAEAALRNAEDGNLWNGILAETAGRENADEELRVYADAAVAAEASARGEADNTLEEHIDREKEDREEGDDALLVLFGAEESARAAADTALQGNIDTVQEHIDQEKEDREDADAILQGNIDTVQEHIDQEKAAREDADAVLEERADALHRLTMDTSGEMLRFMDMEIPPDGVVIERVLDKEPGLREEYREIDNAGCCFDDGCVKREEHRELWELVMSVAGEYMVALDEDREDRGWRLVDREGGPDEYREFDRATGASACESTYWESL